MSDSDIGKIGSSDKTDVTSGKAAVTPEQDPHHPTPGQPAARGPGRPLGSREAWLSEDPADEGKGLDAHTGEPLAIPAGTDTEWVPDPGDFLLNWTSSDIKFVRSGSIVFVRALIATVALDTTDGILPVSGEFLPADDNGVGVQALDATTTNDNKGAIYVYDGLLNFSPAAGVSSGDPLTLQFLLWYWGA